MGKPSNNDSAVQRFREAEQELWKYYGIDHAVTERYVPLRSHPAFLGVRTARVCIFKSDNNKLSPNDESGSIPIVLVHGGGGMAGDWANLLPHLAKQDRIFYMVERPGNGLSEPTDYSGCHLGKFSEHFLEDVLYALGVSKAHLVGNSLGGGTVLWYAFAQWRKGTPEKAASVSVLGVPAGFQGMMFGPQALCWLANLWIVQQVLSRVPGSIPFFTTLVFGLLRIPSSAVSSAYRSLAWRSLSLRHNIVSFLTIVKPLWEASRNGKGWKLGELKALSDRIPVLMAEGKGELFIMPSQRMEIAQQLGEERYIRDLGVGHVPWMADPVGYARVLEHFWNEEESEKTNAERRQIVKTAQSPTSIADLVDPTGTFLDMEPPGMK